jgi:hypothetical protein
MKRSNLTSKNPKLSIVGRTRNFLSRVSNGYVLKVSSITNLMNQPIPEEIGQIENFGFTKPDVTKALIDRALKENSLAKIKVDVKSQEFRDEVNKRAFIKNVKQKIAFGVGAVPMFRTLQEINVAAALNP